MKTRMMTRKREVEVAKEKQAREIVRGQRIGRHEKAKEVTAAPQAP